MGPVLKKRQIRLFKVHTAIACVMLLVSLMALPYSYYRRSSVFGEYRRTADRVYSLEIESGSGTIKFVNSISAQSYFGRFGFSVHDPSSRGSSGSLWDRMGFSYWYIGPFDWQIEIPWWLFTLTAAISLRGLLIRRGREIRQAFIGSNLCLNCGYDLRASIERCPECGTGIPSPNA